MRPSLLLLLAPSLGRGAVPRATAGGKHWQSEISSDGSQVTSRSAEAAASSLTELGAAHGGARTLLRPPAPCGTDNPCQLCENDPESVCSIAPTQDGATMCLPLCGATDPEKVMRSVRMVDDKPCLHDLDSDLLRQLYLKVCPNATRHATATATGCILQVGAISQSNHTDESGTRRSMISVEDGGMVVPKCAHGYAPDVPKLTCARGALFPGSYECKPIPCQAPNSSLVRGVYEGGGCAEGDSVLHGQWCTPRCESGYRAVWPPDVADVGKEPGQACDWPTRPTPTALCCSAGVLMPPRFKCEPYMVLSSTLSTLAVKTLISIASNIVPQGVAIRKVEHAKTADIEKLYAVKTDRGVAVDFRKFKGYFEVLANLSDPLPNESQGLGKFAVNISGQVEVDWLNDTVRCFPDQLKCKINTLAFMHNSHSDFSKQLANPEAMGALNLTTKSERFEWMNTYEDACGFNLCGKIYELSVDSYKKDTEFRKPGADTSKFVQYACSGIDPSYIIFVPGIVLTTITIVFNCFSSQLLLVHWKKQWLQNRRVERLKSQGAAEEAAAAAEGGGESPQASPRG
eukprot:TRINITY_DN10736_c0_g2_i1.p1 TRINITY_DN10736_c0_g2~~TRINITY_DN10736_c0_g2_i1.p1  ORF type:complete len:572 (-),score=104.24 TRINITY_DN10736_c0_g2_i1:133-1848(-)